MPVYVLLIRIKDELTLRVGSLGELTFAPGYYLYVGRAPKDRIFRRIARHFMRDKKLRRHIDYITSKIKPERAFIYRKEESESEMVKKLSNMGRRPVHKRFGSSDDPSSYSHLLYSERLLSLPEGGEEYVPERVETYFL